MRELYTEEVLELTELADLLQHPEKYGCKISFKRGRRAEASRIIESAVASIARLPKRPYPVDSKNWGSA